MATDPNQQNVFITGSDLPAWASETTQQGILNAIKTGDNNIANAIKSGDTNTAKLVTNMNTIMANLISLISGNKDASKSIIDSISRSQKENSEIIQKQVSILRSTIEDKNSNNSNNEGELSEIDKTLNKILKADSEEKRMLEKQFRVGQKTMHEQSSLIQNYLDKTQGIKLSISEIKSSFDEIKNKIGVETPKNDLFGNLSGLLGKGGSIKAGADMAVGTLTSLYSASQVPFEMMMQQVKDRFEITTELRQSGLLEDLGASFVDTTKAFSDNTMTIVEATQFVREFSKAVGVTGTTAALEFVNKTAYATDIMDRYGVNFSQVAKISGTYLDTLERTGMLEQISTTERDRGMKSFMSAVEGVSMVLKTSLEESAKMIRDYLGRDDITAMLMTNSMQLSQEVINEIGAMAKMGPLGEIISKGAIDPNRFMLTPEFQALNNPALSGVRSIAEQMMMELRAGRGTDELVARYTKQMADIVANDPLVGQLVASNDAEVSSIVAGLSKMAQTAQDAINNINVPEVDQAERRRQDAERRKSVTFENLLATSLKSLESSERLWEILNDQTEIINRQIGVVNRMAESADIIADLMSVSATANKAVLTAITATAEQLIGLLPKDDTSAVESSTFSGDVIDKISENSQDIQDTLAVKIERERGQDVRDLLEARTSDWSGWFGEYADYLKEYRDILRTGYIVDDSGNQVQLDENMRAYINQIISQIQAEMSAGHRGGSLGNSYRFNNVVSEELGKIGSSMSELTSIIESETSSVQEKTEAQNKIDAAKAKVVEDQIISRANVYSKSDDEFFDAEGNLLQFDLKELTEWSNLNPEQIQKIIDGISQNEDFKTSVGNDFDKIIGYLDINRQPINQLPSSDTVASDLVSSPTDDNIVLKMNTAELGIKNEITDAIIDGQVSEEELTAIINKVATRKERLELSNEQVGTIISSIKADEELKTDLGGYAESVYAALDSFNAPVVTEQPTAQDTVVIDQQPTAQDTVVIDQQPSFVDALMSQIQDNTEEMRNVYQGVSGIVGDNNVDATEQQFSVYFDELQKSLGDSEESKRQMLQILQQLSESVAANKPQLEQKTGSEDIRILTAKLEQLIGALQ
jgi:nicotinamide mononucleotide adenylyltransferase